MPVINQFRGLKTALQQGRWQRAVPETRRSCSAAGQSCCQLAKLPPNWYPSWKREYYAIWSSCGLPWSPHTRTCNYK